MAISPSDVSVAANGDIRWTGGATPNYEDIELHRFLHSLADDAQASGDDLIDITSDTPSERSTDRIITLLGSYNIDDEMAEHLYGGSITQDSGDTVYSGLQVLGAVNNSATQLMVIQDGDLYQFTTTDTAPYWGTQAAGGYNGNPAAEILMRIMVKTRVNGADIDGKRVRVQARHWGDSYAFFNVTLGLGEAVAAIGTTPDAQNDTAQGTVTAYSDVLNSGGTANAPTGGYQTIDLNNGNGAQPYYSQWTYGAQGDGLKALWEYTKDLSGNGTAKTVDSLNGEFFLGITHEVDYDGLSGSFTERETVVWGTKLFYDTLVSGPFTPGNYVTIGSNGAAGRVMYDDGVDELIVALEDTSITLLNNDVITEYPGVSQVATSTTAAVDTGGGAVVDNDKAGGSGLLLADDTSDTIWFQLLSGVAPVDNLPLRGVTSGATALVNVTITARTVPRIFTGSYTGTYIGAFGVGIDPDDLTSLDTVEDLLGVTQTPPNNVVFTVSGLVASEDRALVGPRAAGILQKDQDTHTSLLNGAAETSIVMTTAIPTDTPTPGTIRVELASGIYKQQSYTSYTGSTYTIPSTDYSTDNASAGSNVFISYIDELASGTTATFTSIFLSTRDLFVRVRDGGATPIKTFESDAAQLTSTGGTVAAIRTSDA